MRSKVCVKSIKKKGMGVSARTSMRSGDVLLTKDITKLRKYKLDEINSVPQLTRLSDHCDYAGYGRYVIDFSPASYINHSCAPNAYVDFKTIGKSKYVALRDIAPGEEITVDYTLGAIDQIGSIVDKYGLYRWKLPCRCGSKNCRRIVTGDFFSLPLKLQREKAPYLPALIRRRFRRELMRLGC